jgi:thiosulfate/3-mercaptopyruvate sulfurtransferase
MAAVGPLVDGRWLQEHLGEPGLRVIDLRWYLDGRSGRAAYEAGHIPGAAFVDLDSEITGRIRGQGRHPLPARENFELAMRRAGVGRESHVVVYDDEGGFSDAAHVAPGDFVASPARESAKLDFEELRGSAAGLVLLDARSGERFRGEVEPIDPKAGHIPGARSVPWQSNLDGQKRFLPRDQLRRHFQQLGVRSGDQVVAYCGSGVSACHHLLALEVAGLLGARLYPGSWSDWSTRDDAPVATGPEET